MLEFYADSKYLVFPVSSHVQNKRLLFYVDGKLVYDLVFGLDYDQPDSLFPLNIERFHGKTVEIDCDMEVELRIDKRDTADTSYDGKYRPYAHFTAKRGWINDPNGLVYYKGYYHLFFQHNPVDCKWGNMHWGHAVSSDLMHWQEKEIALYPDEGGTMFSGSAVIDWNNVTGLKESDEEVILLFYTCAGDSSIISKGKPFTQNLAYSVDGGETFIKYEKNPLIPQVASGNRDPKVICYEPDGSYIMALYLESHDYVLYRSENMLEWRKLQHIQLPEDGECPDFFPLAVDGDRKNIKWVFMGASDRYLIGNFDGERFTAESTVKRLNYGKHSYAAQSWAEVPNRRIRTAFSDIIIPGEPYASCLNVPQEMSLRTIHGEIRLCAEPVKEIENLYTEKRCFKAVHIAPEQPFRHPVSSKCCDVMMRLPLGYSFVLTLFGLEVRYDSDRSALRCLEKEALVQGEDGFLTLRFVIDTINTEIFADSGSVFMGMPYIQDYNLRTLSVVSKELVEGVDIDVAQLRAFWEEQ